MNIVLGFLITLVIVVVIVWIGLKVKPKPFTPFPAQNIELKTMILPDDLPVPVTRFYHAIFGDEIPIIESAVISGRAKMRLFGLTLPGRFRFIHDAGMDYRHYMETTFFGLPIMKVNEFYLDGNSRLELPFGVTEGEAKINQAANLGLWAESVWLPSVFITDPRVRWDPGDENTALLRVPFGETEETFVVRFDPHTGLISHTESMRYKDAAVETKTLWINEAKEWQDQNGELTLVVGAVTWFDDGLPWAVFSVDEVVYNADVSEYVRRRGP